MKGKTIQYSELVPAVMSAEVFRKLKLRGKLEIARSAGPGIEPTIYVESIPEPYKMIFIQNSEVQDQDSLFPASNFQCKTCAKKGKKNAEIRKSAEPLDIQSFRKRYPQHSNNHTLIRHIVFSKWRASRGKTSENQI